jgi:hypothetical protein
MCPRSSFGLFQGLFDQFPEQGQQGGRALAVSSGLAEPRRPLFVDNGGLKSKLEGRLFQQNGARLRAAKSSMGNHGRKRIDVLPNWPPYCPDLNAIGGFWKGPNARAVARCPMTLG